MNSANRLSIESVSYIYPGADTPVVNTVTCHLERGEIVALVGPSASGKSTFGRLLKGLIEPTAGKISIHFSGERQSEDSPATKLKLVGWTGAHPEVQLFAASVWDEVAFGPVNQGLNSDEIDNRVRTALKRIGLDAENFGSRHPLFLSGGEQRRVALAGVVAMDCAFYIFDEPTAGFDRGGCRSFINLVCKLRNQGCGILWISHNINSLSEVADRVWGFQRGRMAFDHPAAEINWEELKANLRSGTLFG